ncbi:putative mucin TcMUCII [Trypanosoma cruzi]|uniref:Mucin TcMUCII, putative n=2 Tax=Trypanosoma cruzi TaxID=5693 RepID=Q4DWG0_TRYCC|nr:mucin TcMUCII, putative [Trypanosoma cruzi]EAN96847.1 mucin TcMUCII, putative [Trypanosoma cruzi]KAF8300902.1 putative mucin TcMUCII [Trypanosoma cruzi]PWV09594.1 putative mucin TcMUCII [Trypanosoma cruzi]RNC41968.1 mucin TcMUCII [Trypanosoma cruzi]|eukprot:XP_818698.1 mucin TcMUCII [Trypanosoma cruzi strain CL Brener]
MMMTCRLLCALLVLALCCCPSVCASETEEIPVDLEAEDEVDGRVTGPEPAAPGVPLNQNQVQAESPEAAPSLPPPPTEPTTPAANAIVSATSQSTPASDTNPTQDVTMTTATRSKTQTQGNKTNFGVEPNGTSTSVPSPPSVAPPQGTGQPGSSSNGAAAEHENTAGNRGVLPSSHPQSSGAHNTVQREGTEDTSGTKSRTRTSTEHANKNVDDPAETTTTTTTKPPTTTTTTAPEAPTTTTTEAPTTTTTTRAPSRLREMDGSPSSSAWVCAPLVLAASALAYTTLG